jgi:catechol 2,3-dioxygenase
MGATTQDIFGRADRAEAAVPGSYGQAPGSFRLPDSTRLGSVRLQVSDLTRSLAFYQNVLGLHRLAGDAASAMLGVPGAATPLVELRELRGARPVPRRGALGLYHFAILLPHRPSLGRFLRHLGEVGARAGASDHLVSESLYLQDPDNLGIEVYADRPRSSWRRVGRELMMATDPIDTAGLLEAAGNTSWESMPTGTTIGHVHLHVGDLEQAAGFYSEGIGLDRTVWHYPGALFMAAGGYHHHLGTNTWAGVGATPALEQDARLLEWTIELPDPAKLSNLAESLSRSGYSVRWEEDSAARSELVTRDPWETQLRVRTIGSETRPA